MPERNLGCKALIIYVYTCMNSSSNITNKLKCTLKYQTHNKINKYGIRRTMWYILKIKFSNILRTHFNINTSIEELS